MSSFLSIFCSRHPPHSYCFTLSEDPSVSQILLSLNCLLLQDFLQVRGPDCIFYANWFLLLILFIVFPFWFMVVLFAGYSSELFSHLNVYHIMSIFTLLLVHFVSFLCHQHTSGGIMFLTCPSSCAYMNVCQYAFRGWGILWLACRQLLVHYFYCIAFWVC